jgi:hypothetical protein
MDKISQIFHFFDGEDLTPIQRILKNIGSISIMVATFGAALISLNGGNVTGSIWSSIGLYSLAIGGIIVVFCFLGVGVYSIGKSKGITTTGASVIHVLKKVFLIMFLPAIILTFILSIILLPR